MLDPDQYINTGEVAQMIGVKASTIRGWRHALTEPIKSVKIGSAVLYRRTDVEAYATRSQG